MHADFKTIFGLNSQIFSIRRLRRLNTDFKTQPEVGRGRRCREAWSSPSLSKAVSILLTNSGQNISFATPNAVQPPRRFASDHYLTSYRRGDGSIVACQLPVVILNNIGKQEEQSDERIDADGRGKAVTY